MQMRTSPRSLKLATEIQKIIPFLITKYTNPAEQGIISVTRVEVSGDLGIAEIFLSQMGSNKPFLNDIRKKKKIIAHDIAEKIKTRRVLELRFSKDKTAQNIARITSI